MADGTKIEWTDATANVINGCSLESPGCTNCYAMKQAHRFPVRQGLTKHTKGGMVWTGEVRFHLTRAHRFPQADGSHIDCKPPLCRECWREQNWHDHGVATSREAGAA